MEPLNISSTVRENLTISSYHRQPAVSFRILLAMELPPRPAWYLASFIQHDTFEVLRALVYWRHLGSLLVMDVACIFMLLLGYL